MPSNRSNRGSDVPPEPRKLITLVRFTTDDLAPDDRFQAWYRRDWPNGRPIYRTDPIEPFNTRWVSAMLGPVMFVRTEITGMRWERRLDDIRTSDFDPIIVSMMKDGEAHGDFDGRPFHETAGTFHFHDLGRPSLHVSTASLTYNLVIARPLAEQWFGSLTDLHGLVVSAEEAALVFALAEQVSGLLVSLDTDQADRLGRTFLEVLSVALAAVRPPREDSLSSAQQLRRVAADWIELRLGTRALNVGEICQALGVSRGQLFSAFQPDGGVRTFIQTRRLERSRAALADPDRAEAIGLIAHRLGFADAAHLSRAFRARYGMTPSQYRHLLRADRERLAPKA